MLWVPLIAWVAALVLAAVVLGFCGHELVWKRRRLRADLETLQQLRHTAAEVQAGLSDAKQRAALVAQRQAALLTER